MSRPLVRFARPAFGKEEKKAVAFVMKKAMQVDAKPLTNAGHVREFEEKFSELTGGMAVAVSSCAAALYLCLLAKGIGRGDTVILPALTHVALPNAVELLGANCHFVDSHITSGNLDPDVMIAPPGARIVSVTHFLGQPAYMGTMAGIARRHGMEILEDCALALGTTHSGRHVGLLGMAGCFSFYPCKHIATAEGGMVVTKNPLIAEAVTKLRSFGYGSDRDAGVEFPGLNFRMTEFQGALGVAQLDRFEELNSKRTMNAGVLREHLRDFQVIGGNYALSVFVRNRDAVRAEMARKGIETSVYYPRPIHKHPYYEEKYGKQRFPVAEKICAETITLSVGPHLTADHMELQARVLRECLKSKPVVRVTNASGIDRRRRIHRPSSGAAAA